MKASKPASRRRRPPVTPLCADALSAEADEISGLTRPASTNSLPTKPASLMSPARTLLLEVEGWSPKRLPGVVQRSFSEPARPDSSISMRSRSSSRLASGTPTQQRAAAQALRRRVCFCPTPKNTSHPITPYSKVYGMHPTYFDFDRRGRMQLTDEGVAKEMLDEALAAPD